ncbi:MAG: hypothetical protein GMKNLPBB_02355 [Myxococcota bacterium]|nr:hypothetical protein [Myxococcota bacterium]
MGLIPPVRLLRTPALIGLGAAILLSLAAAARAQPPEIKPPARYEDPAARVAASKAERAADAAIQSHLVRLKTGGAALDERIRPAARALAEALLEEVRVEDGRLITPEAPDALLQQICWRWGLSHADILPMIVAHTRPGLFQGVAGQWMESRDKSLEKRGYASGAAVNRDGVTLVAVLFMREYIRLRPLPRRLPEPGSVRLHGQMGLSVSDPSVFVTRPDGSVERMAAAEINGRVFTADVELPARGVHRIELVARTSGGLTVTNLFPVAVGADEAPPRDSPASQLLKEDGGGETPLPPEDRLFEAVNRFRRMYGLPAFHRDPLLDQVARAHCADMAKQGFFGHQSPVTGDLAARLREEKIGFRFAGENVARHPTLENALAGILESPGHRALLLDDRMNKAGVGLVPPEGGREFYLVTFVAIQPGDGQASAGKAREAIFRMVDDARRSRGLVPLEESAVLSNLAARFAGRLRELHPEPGQVRVPPHWFDEVFEEAKVIHNASIDIHVSPDLKKVLSSKNLSSQSFNRIGAGVAYGEGPGQGSSLYWIVLIFGSTAK